MSEVLSFLGLGFASLLDPMAWLIMLVGTAMGIFFGAMPGLSATTGMALMLPIAYRMDVNLCMLMMAGIYSGALYGGSISAILLGIPGTAAALPTTFDGYPLTRKGHSKDALLAGLYGSAMGGIFSAVVLMFLTPFIAAIAIKFGSPEMFALGLWGISMVTSVAGGDVVKGLFMAALGLIVGTVGAAPVTGEFRFTFGSLNMISGFALVPLLLGTLALPGVMSMIETLKSDEQYFEAQKEKKWYFKLREVTAHWKTIIASSFIGTFIGIAPAAGPTMAAMVAYNTAKQSSDDPDSYGKGNVDGVWASETANNAATGGSLVFALSIGIPGSAAAAVLMSALVMRGIQPGPLLLTNSSDLVYTFFAGFFVVQFIVWLEGHGFVALGAQIIKTPMTLLAPTIVVLCAVGAYSVNGMFGVYCAFGSCIVGYVLTKMKFPMSPFLLSVLLCSTIESNFWTMEAMTLGNIWIVFKRPLFIIILLIAILSFLMPVFQSIRRKKRKAADPSQEKRG